MVSAEAKTAGRSASSSNAPAPARLSICRRIQHARIDACGEILEIRKGARARPLGGQRLHRLFADAFERA
jgi:hypothetical protein